MGECCVCGERDNSGFIRFGDDKAKMNGIKYAEWASHYDPENLEIKFLHTHGINFLNSRVIEVGCGTGRFTKRIINDCRDANCLWHVRVCLFGKEVL